MSAATLRRAATLMGERAKDCQRDVIPPWYVSEDAVGLESIPRPDRAHVAAWSPAVALAVADWLDQHAAEHDTYDCYWEPCAALVAARAYLGEDAPR